MKGPGPIVDRVQHVGPTLENPVISRYRVIQPPPQLQGHGAVIGETDIAGLQREATIETPYRRIHIPDGPTSETERVVVLDLSWSEKHRGFQRPPRTDPVARVTARIP